MGFMTTARSKIARWHNFCCFATGDKISKERARLPGGLPHRPPYSSNVAVVILKLNGRENFVTYKK
jgi:hypothetical protein